jgi:hypothetical protein
MKKLHLFIGLFSIVLVSCKTPERIVNSYEVILVTPESVEKIEKNQRYALGLGESSHFFPTGMFYALPRQSVEVDISIRKQEFIKGLYAEFSERLLGVTNVIRENSVAYSIENISVSQRAEPNPEQIYFVQFNDSKLALDYDNGLIISGVNLSQTNATEFQNRKKTENQIMQSGQIVNRPIFSTTSNLVERNDTVFFSQMVDSVLVQRYEIRTVQTPKTPLQRAQEIVDAIAKIRDDRTKLLTGFQEVNYEMAAIRYMNEEFNRMEDEYIRLFTGTIKTTYETSRFSFLPTNKDSLTIDLAGFSSNLGLIDLNLIEWAPEASIVSLNMVLQDNILIGIQQFSNHMIRTKQGFYYNIPSPALVTVKLENHTLFSRQLFFSQFGLTPSLAPDLLQIDFSPQTGEIRSIRTIGE